MARERGETWILTAALQIHSGQCPGPPEIVCINPVLSTCQPCLGEDAGQLCASTGLVQPHWTRGGRVALAWPLGQVAAVPGVRPVPLSLFPISAGHMENLSP